MNHKEKEGRVILSGIRHTGLIIVGFTIIGLQGIILLAGILSFFVKINISFDKQFLGLLLLLLLILFLILVGFRYKIVLDEKTMILQDKFLGIKIRSFSISTSKVLLETFPPNEPNQEYIYVNHNLNYWDATYDRDWLEFFHNGKIIFIAGNSRTVGKIESILLLELKKHTLVHSKDIE